MIRNKYVIILVDCKVIADKINSATYGTKHHDTRVQAFAVGTQMVGLRHRNTRPTLVIDAITDRSHERFDDWYVNCVRPSAVNAEVISLFKEAE